MLGDARAPPNMVNVSKGGCLARSRAGLILTSRFGTEGARHTPSSIITPSRNCSLPLAATPTRNAAGHLTARCWTETSANTTCVQKKAGHAQKQHTTRCMLLSSYVAVSPLNMTTFCPCSGFPPYPK